MARIAALVLTLAVLPTVAPAQPALQPAPAPPPFAVLEGNANSFGPLLPRNRPTDVRGVQAVCTGADPDSRGDPRWAAYPLRLEFTAADGSDLVFAQAAVVDAKSKPIVSVRCPGAWLLLALPPGEYRATIAVPNLPDQRIGFAVPRRGQKVVVIRFISPGAAGQAVAAPPQ